MFEIRHRRRCSPLVALAAAAGLALTGCATDEAADPDPVPEPPPAGAPPAAAPPDGAPADGADGPVDDTADGTAAPEAVTWTGSVCQALVPVVQTLRNPPPIEVTAPQAAQRAYSDYLAQARTQAEQAQQELGSLGAPPVEGGEELTQEIREQVTDLREDVIEARERIDAADPGNPVAIGEAIVAGGNVLGAVGNNVQAVGALTAEPELRNAFEQAPACDQLRMAGGPS